MIKELEILLMCNAWRKTASLTAGVIVLVFFAGISSAQTTPSPVSAQKIEKLLAETSAAIQSNEIDYAKRTVQELLTLAPRNAAVHTLIGIIADQENDLRKAEKHFSLAARLDPGASTSRNNYGAILLRLGRSKEAAREFAASLAANPNQSSALVNLAQIKLAEGELRSSRELFERAKKNDPADVEVLRALLSISLTLREKERAGREFKDYASALKAATEMASMDASQSVAVAKNLFANDLINEAEQELSTALSINKSDIDALILLSKVYLRQKNISSAGRLLESAVAAGLDNAAIYFALAEVYEAGGFMENAIPAMRRAIEKDPKNDFYRSRYGLLLVHSKAPAAAVIRLNEALKEFPDSPSLWLALGIAQFDDNKMIEARRSFEKALSLEPKLASAMAYLGAVYVEQAQYAEAVKIYEQAIDINKDIALLHYLLGDTLLKMTDADARTIEAELKRAIELDNTLGSAYLALGKLYVRQSRWTEAAALMERALQLEPERAETLYQLGRVYARLKRTNESKAMLGKFRQLSDSQKEQKEFDRRELVNRLAKVRF